MSVTLADVGRHFPSRPRLFREVHVHLSPDDVTTLVGPSGSGEVR